MKRHTNKSSLRNPLNHFFPIVLDAIYISCAHLRFIFTYTIDADRNEHFVRSAQFFLLSSSSVCLFFTLLLPIADESNRRKRNRKASQMKIKIKTKAT